MEIKKGKLKVEMYFARLTVFPACEPSRIGIDLRVTNQQVNAHVDGVMEIWF